MNYAPVETNYEYLPAGYQQSGYVSGGSGVGQQQVYNTVQQVYNAATSGARGSGVRGSGVRQGNANLGY